MSTDSYDTVEKIISNTDQSHIDTSDTMDSNRKAEFLARDEMLIGSVDNMESQHGVTTWSFKE